MIAAARSFLGAEWGHAKRLPQKMDCLGLGELSIAAVRPIPRAPKDYGRLPHNKRLSAGLTEYLGEPITGAPRPGDVVTLRWTGEENHVAIVVDHPDRPFGLIHCDMHAPGSERGRVIEHGADQHWCRRIVQVWRP